MKTTGKFKSAFFLVALCFLMNPAFCQKTASGEKIKSIIVYEETFDALVSKKLKDIETYYDEKGNVIEEINYKEGKITKHFKYQYDGDNNKIKEEEFDPSGKLIEYSEYKIENGLRVEKAVYDKNKKLKSKKTYQYTTFEK
jgi:antitoxin component YwqK of YwqJK toxin-antitoxin module